MGQLTIRTTGNLNIPIKLLEVRDLTEADLIDLQSEPRDQETALDRITSRHHALARVLASGISQEQAAASCGYTGNRVAILLGDPTFKELVNYYKNIVEDEYISAHRELVGVMGLGTRVLAERLERELEIAEEGGEGNIGTSMVLDIVTQLADRTGHGVSSTQAVVAVDMSTKLRERREAARRAAVELAGEARDITPSVAAE